MGMVEAAERQGRGRALKGMLPMTDKKSITELEQRIADIRENIRVLIEQAAARSGAADEDLASDRIAQQSEALERLEKERDALLNQKGG